MGTLNVLQKLSSPNYCLINELSQPKWVPKARPLTVYITTTILVKDKHHLESKKDSEMGNMKMFYGAKFQIVKSKNIGFPFQN